MRADNVGAAPREPEPAPEKCLSSKSRDVSPLQTFRGKYLLVRSHVSKIYLFKKCVKRRLKCNIYLQRMVINKCCIFF